MIPFNEGSNSKIFQNFYHGPTSVRGINQTFKMGVWGKILIKNIIFVFQNFLA